MAKVMPQAELEHRDGDERLSPEQIIKISIFQGLNQAAVEKYPGAIVLRRYRKGDIVCRQGDAGWTAFYILRTADVLSLSEGQPSIANTLDRAELFRRAETLAQCESVDKSLAERDATLLRLDAGAKRLRAKQVESVDAEISSALRQSADGDDLRQKAVVSLQFSKPTTERNGSWFTRLLTGRMKPAPRRTDSATRTYIPIDGPVDLQYDNPIAKLHEGELFGEMCCLNRAPRSATVRVTDDCTMIEMLRNIFEVLQKNKAFKEQMDAVYRRRVLATHLRGLPLFSDLSETLLHELADRVELIEKEPGEIIFREGEPADSLYVIRVGTVKVSRKAPGGPRVLAYRARGEHIGEIGLLRNEPRMATCEALDHPVGEGAAKRRPGRVELVRVSRDEIERLLNEAPQLRERLEATAAERLRPESRPAVRTVSLLRQSDELGLLQGQKLMLIDLERCTRCDECVRACASTHADGRTRLIREGERFGRYLVPSTCRQCLDPVCMIGCPVGSIHKGSTGEILIEDWCIGCEICAKQCPYDAINMHERRAGDKNDAAVDVAQNAVVCDQCASLKDGIPSCVYACPHDAALRVDARQFFERQLEAVE
ncbi:MAG: cyclic nucleotide-binding domain-containing protein [Planctomycetota bacterium]